MEILFFLFMQSAAWQRTETTFNLMNQKKLQAAKHRVLAYCDAFDHASESDMISALRLHTHEDYSWRGMFPFHELSGHESVVELFWRPLKLAVSHLQRRPDVFMAGGHSLALHAPDSGNKQPMSDDDIWVCQMGHFMGLFDKPWLDIPPHHRMLSIRYVEFHRVVDDRIAESALFFDLIGVMHQAGQNPLPPQSGASFVYPGPRTHDGLLLSEHPQCEGDETLQLINRMVADLSRANQHALETNDNIVAVSTLAKTWHEDMIWYGPEGIGATYTLERYQHQHQYPFRFNLGSKTFNGHVARFAEGNYGCFFGWPNLTNTALGGFLGLTGNTLPADMRVVDVYRREGHKLAENWVIIDLPHWLSMQGLDVLVRMRQLLGKETFV